MKKAMPPLRLDYLRTPPGRQLPGLALLAAAVVAAILLVVVANDLAGDIDAAEHRVARLRQAAERQRIFAANEASTVKAEPAAPAPPDNRWDILLDALEAAADDNVTLLSLTPGTREIVITGEAAGLDAALDYARRLQTQGAFSHAHLAKYEQVRDHPRQPVQFTVLADWPGAAP